MVQTFNNEKEILEQAKVDQRYRVGCFIYKVIKKGLKKKLRLSHLYFGKGSSNSKKYILIT